MQHFIEFSLLKQDRMNVFWVIFNNEMTKYTRIHEVCILSWDELIYFPLTDVRDPLSVQIFPLVVKFKFCGSLDFASGAGIR